MGGVIMWHWLFCQIILGDYSLILELTTMTSGFSSLVIPLAFEHYRLYIVNQYGSGRVNSNA